MKRLLLFLTFSFVLLGLQAQEEVVCMPDTLYQDSSAGVYPLPLNNGTGGLATFPACIGEDYELVFTVKLGDSILVTDLFPDPIDVVSAALETTGAVAGLPQGLNYFCNPPDCIFPDSLLGCIVVKGIPAADNAVKDYDLVITGLANLKAFGAPLQFPLVFPGPLAAGSYAITLNEAGNCENVTTSTNYLEERISLGNTPNPVSGLTTIEATSLLDGDFQFSVYDMSGRTMHQEQIHLNVGYNSFNYDASGVEDGMYLYTISDGSAMIFEKMMVRK